VCRLAWGIKIGPRTDVAEDVTTTPESPEVYLLKITKQGDPPPQSSTLRPQIHNLVHTRLRQHGRSVGVPLGALVGAV